MARDPVRGFRPTGRVPAHGVGPGAGPSGRVERPGAGGPGGGGPAGRGRPIGRVGCGVSVPPVANGWQDGIRPRHAVPMDSSTVTSEPAAQPVTLRAGSDELRPVFEQLWQLYWHDLSEFRGVVPRADGTYRSDRLAPYFGEPDHHAHLIHHGEDLAGFVLTRPLPEGARSVYAFFVVRALRRQGVGHRAAREMLRLHPGRWAIAFQEENPGAARFWRQLAADAVGTAWREERRPVPPPAPSHLPDDVWILLDTTHAP